jgi:hypothetical protein
MAISHQIPSHSRSAHHRLITRLINDGSLERRDAVCATPGSKLPIIKKVRPSPPPAIGALNTILEHNVCHHIEADSLSDEGARMCGQPGFPWCEYHAKYNLVRQPQSAEARDAAAQRAREAYRASPFGRHA